LSGKALGMIETEGLIPAVEGLDAGLKAANVSFYSLTFVGGGLVTFIFEGDVGAVNAAVDAAAAAAQKLGRVVSRHVMAKPHESVSSAIPPRGAAAKEPHSAQIEVAPVEPEPPAELKTLDGIPIEKAALSEVKTVDLRRMARQIPNIDMTRDEIKLARKDNLVDKILSAYGVKG